jgi:hypothetical protein
VTSALAEASAQISTLNADKTRLASELAAANETVATLHARIQELESIDTAAELAVPQPPLPPGEADALASTTAELERATAANEALKTDLGKAREDFAEMRKTARLTEEERDRLQKKLDKERVNPSAPNGTFDALAGAVDYAGRACDSAASQPNWDCNELKRLVGVAVWNMTPQTSRAELDRKVQQVRVLTKRLEHIC